jgi:putative transposase
MIESVHRLSVRQQCKLLSLHRSGVYYEPAEPRYEDRHYMRLIDEQYLRTPFFGSRQMATWLSERVGRSINRKRVQALMRIMDLQGMAPGPSTSRRQPQHKIYPYLLRDLEVTRANQVWAADITYLPMEHGFGYLVAIMDWHSRMVLAWKLSNSLDTNFCVSALEEALRQWGTPDIFNTDQGTQFTAEAWIEVLTTNAVRISMDGKGRCIDNVFVERLWRTVKYEEVYLHAYDDLDDARDHLAHYFAFYNDERPHQSLRRCPPSAAYYQSLGRQYAASVRAA